MASYVKVNNAWKVVIPQNQWVKVNSQFRRVADRRIKVNGIWRNAN